jgi:hypothetical protein
LQGPRTSHAAAVQDSARARPQTFAKSAGFALREANSKYKDKGKIIMGLEAIRIKSPARATRPKKCHEEIEPKTFLHPRKPAWNE